MKPDFIVPGAGKSGTSTLNQYLNQHPAICISRPGEPMFFSHDHSNSQRLGTVGFNDGFDAYERCFSHCEAGKLRGEGSTSYMFFPGVIERLLKYAPETKFIFIFRNPVDRVYSHYNFNRQHGSEARPLPEAFEDSINLEIKTWENRTAWGGYYYYYQNGLSGEWLNRYIQSFGHDRIYTLSFEDLKNAPLDTMDSIFQFLGVDPLDEINKEHTNKTKILKHPKAMGYASKIWLKIKETPLGRFLESLAVKDIVRERLGRETPVPPLTETDRAWLADFFREDVAKLESLTGRSWTEWKDF